MEAYEYLAQVYNELMNDVDYDLWGAYIRSLLGFEGGHIFEAACGTGNISNRLYDMGYDMIAADVSDAMLREAAQNARKMGRDIMFVNQDMRSIHVGNKVRAVVSACDGANYIDEQGLKSFASSAFNALKNGGLLLFDISTRAKLAQMDKQVYYDDSDDVTCIWRNAFDAQKGVLRMDVTLFVRKGELFERYSETHVQYAHTLDNVRHIMLSAGFAQADVYEFPTNNVCTDAAHRAQFVCRKQ